MLKVYDFIITNVDILANSSSQNSVSRIFEEHATNFCFKNIPRISLEYYKVIKMFLWSQKAERIVLVSYPVKFVILSVSSLECFSELYWNHFSFREMFSKGSYRCLTAGKKITISTTLLSIHNMIIVIINLFCQVINISVCSAYGSAEWENLCNCTWF